MKNQNNRNFMYIHNLCERSDHDEYHIRRSKSNDVAGSY